MENQDGQGQLHHLLRQIVEQDDTIHLIGVLWVSETTGVRQATTIAQETNPGIDNLPVRITSGDYMAGQVLNLPHAICFGSTDCSIPSSYPLAPTSRSGYYYPVLGQRGQLLAVLCLESPHPNIWNNQRLPDALYARIQQIQHLLEYGPYQREFVACAMPDAFVVRSEKMLQQPLAFANEQATLYAIAVSARNLVHRADRRMGSAIFMKRPMPQAMLSPHEKKGRDFLVLLAKSGDEQLNPPAIIPMHDDAGENPRSSIASHVLETGEPYVAQYIQENMAYPGRIPVFPGYEPFNKGSEISVPIKEGWRAFGTIVVKCLDDHTFNDEDKKRLVAYAQAVLRIIRRCNSIQLERRDHDLTELRLEYTARIENLHLKIDRIARANDTIETFPPSKLGEILDEGKKIFDDIVKDARNLTHSDYAILGLAEGRNDRSVEMVLYHVDPQPHDNTNQGSFRWSPQEGPSITFTAFEKQQLIISNNTRAPDSNFRSAPDITQGKLILSEMAYPLHRNPEQGRSLGVLDVESMQLEHYDDISAAILGELGHQVELIQDAIDIAINRWYANQLLLIVNELTLMHAKKDLIFIQERRQRMLQHLIDNLRVLTDATTVQIYIGANTLVRQADSFEESERIVCVRTAPPIDLRDPPETVRRYSPIDTGIAGEVYRTGERQLFKNALERASTAYIPNIIDNAESEITRPIKDEQETIGILNVESEKPYCFNRNRRYITKLAQLLASSIITGYHLCLAESQSALLTDFQQELLKGQNTLIADFVKKVCQDLYQLTGSSSDSGIRWARLVLTYPYTTHRILSYIFDNEGKAQFEDIPPEAMGHLSEVLDFSLQREAPVLVLDTKEDKQHPLGTPWPDARALISVPIFLPSVNTCIALLVVASPTSCTLNNYDLDAIKRFAQSIGIALEHQAFSHARQSLLSRLIVDESLFQPYRNKFDELARLLDLTRHEVPATPQLLLSANRLMDDIKLPYNSYPHILYWLLLLFRNISLPQRLPLSAASQTEELLAALVAELRAASQVWTNISEHDTKYDTRILFPSDEQTPLCTLRGPQDAISHLKAALFGCIVSAHNHTRTLALDKQHQQEITVHIGLEGPLVVFTIAFASTDHLSKDDLLPRITIENNQVVFTEQYLVACRSIIEWLGGTLDVHSADATRHMLIVRIPQRIAHVA